MHRRKAALTEEQSVGPSPKASWEGEDALGIRWNGESDSDADIGFPKSRNIPIWFIVPDPLKPLILAAVGLAWHIAGILPHPDA